MHAKSVADRLQRHAPAWELTTAGVVILLLTVLSCWGVERLSVYWSKDSSEYYNPNYTEGNDVDNVIIHATCGFMSFLLVPGWLVVSWYAPDSWILKITTVASAIAVIATFATVPLIKHTIIGSKSGKAVTATAVVWAIWWMTCLIVAGGTRCCQSCGKPSGRFGSMAWWFRFMGMSVFGFALLPVFYNLRDTKVGSAFTLILLLLVVVFLSEWICWRGFTTNESDATLEVQQATPVASPSPDLNIDVNAAPEVTNESVVQT